MPWNYEKKTRKKWLEKQKDVRAKAKAIHRAHVKRIIREEMFVIHGALAWRALDEFQRKEEVSVSSVLLVLVMDQYKVFTKRDAYLWGLAHNQQNLYRLIAYAREKGLISENSAKRDRVHYLTLKGQRIVKEFNEFYKQRAKLIFKSNANDNRDLIYKFSTIKPKRSYKLDDTTES